MTPDQDPAIKPTEATDNPNVSTEHQKQGDARRPRMMVAGRVA